MLSEVQAVNQTISDEIDLRELFLIIYQGKLLVVISTLLFSLVAGVYAYKAQEWWTAEAVVDEPHVYDVEKYYMAVQELKQLLSDGSEDGYSRSGEEESISRYAESPLDRYLEPSTLLYHFEVSFNSASTKKAFLLQDEIFNKYLLENNRITEKQKLSDIKQWSKSIVMVPREEGEKRSLLELKFQSLSSLASAEQLRSYIEYVLLSSRKKILRSIEAMKTSQQQRLLHRLNLRERKARGYIELEIARYNHAYKIAAAADIAKPMRDQIKNEEEYFPISLGAGAIAARIDALKSIKDLSIVDPEIMGLRFSLASLQAFTLPPDLQFSMFSYVDTAEAPLTRDKPKRLLIVVLGLLLGGLFGVFFVLVRAFVNGNGLNSTQ